MISAMECRIMESSLCFSVSCGSINKCRFSSQEKPFSICFPQTRRSLSLKASSMSINDDDTKSFTYKDSGVDIDAETRRIMYMVPGIGGFSGGFSVGDYKVVVGMNGVGSKLKLAFEMGIHDTVGIDLVAMSVNDIVTCGAVPVGFEYCFGCHRLDVDLEEMVIKGMIDGCQQSSYDPIGPCIFRVGETVERPDVYAKDEYDLVGCAVGKVKKDSIIDGKNIVAGDVLIGLPSSGLHSNGFSIARRVMAQSGYLLKDEFPGGSSSLGDALMVPTIIYVKQVLGVINKGGVKGLAHVTGGGLTDNIPRILPDGLGVVIHTNAWEVPPLFSFIQKHGNVEVGEMRRTFNMGIGMVMVVSPEAALRILGDAENGSYVAYRIGEVTIGEGVTYY